MMMVVVVLTFIYFSGFTTVTVADAIISFRMVSNCLASCGMVAASVVMVLLVGCVTHSVVMSISTIISGGSDSLLLFSKIILDKKENKSMNS